jgi:hypothetical protein
MPRLKFMKPARYAADREPSRINSRSDLMRTIEQIIRDVNPISPRNIHHPIHDEAWLALARALGRMDARKDFEIIHGKAPANDNDPPKTQDRRPR